MSGELQTIPARHGVATFVPRGRTIKVINTYGKQVVSMWAFSLGAPPEKDGEGEGEGEEIDEEQVKEEAEELKKAVEEGGKAEATPLAEESNEESSKGKEPAKSDEAAQEESSGGKETQTTSKDEEESKDDAEDPPEQAPDTPANEKTTEDTDAPADKKATDETDAATKQASKRTWASYLPSIPYRNKATSSKPDAEQKATAESEKAQNEENTKKWSSYIPTGKSFSSYVPNVQLPDSKEAVSAFRATHNRDPNKSYAEQLYDFSKTPVGAGTIAAATGSGYASSAYAVYSAYTSVHASNSSQAPMEYLSLPHSRASSHKLVPEVNDELLTNLRNPIVTLVEDTSPGAHDTLTAACDANQYTALGIEKPEEHGSCAENLVLALKELNETAGLKGAKAIGADISVNIAPTPLHLFMNAPLFFEESDANGAGAKGITLQVEEPKGKKRSYVRFRAERDVVVVLSACPMDVGSQNGGRCMAANFMVEDVQEGEDLAASVEKGKSAPKKITQKGRVGSGAPKKEVKKEEDKAPEEKTEESVPESEAKIPEPEKKKPKKLAPKDAGEKKSASPAPKAPEKEDAKDAPAAEEAKPKKKPRKLQPRA